MRVVVISLWLFMAVPLHAAEIWLGITTTLKDSGVMTQLIDRFEELTSHDVVVVAMPSGQTLQAARDHNFDVVITHDEHLETQFHEQGWGDERIPLMESKFVLAGPTQDPAKVKGLDIDQAFRVLAQTQAEFVTRQDDSGTSARENEIWARNNIHDLGFRIETGQGMGATLNIASAMQAYVFTELATFLNFKNKAGLGVLVDQGSDLRNIYSISTLNSARFQDRKLNIAGDLVDFLRSDDAEKIINNYQITNETPFRALN